MHIKLLSVLESWYYISHQKGVWLCSLETRRSMGLLFNRSLGVFPLTGALHSSGASRHPYSSSSFAQKNTHLLHETVLLHVYTCICIRQSCCNRYMHMYIARHNCLKANPKNTQHIHNPTEKFTATHSRLSQRERPALKSNTAEGEGSKEIFKHLGF